MRGLAHAIRLAFLGPLAGLLFSCGGGGASEPGPTGGGTGSTCPIPVTPAVPTWTGHVYPMLNGPTCGAASTSCHGGASASGRLDFSADATTLFNSLVNQPSTTFNLAGWAIIKPGDSSRSWLYEKIQPAAGGQPGLGAGNPVGSRMPLGGTLCTPTTDTVKAWIDQGATSQ